MNVGQMCQRNTVTVQPSDEIVTAARPDIAVLGDALEDPSFTDRGDDVLYRVDPGTARGPFEVAVELLYQPIGYRWAHNLEQYDATEPQRFVGYFKSMRSESAVVLARASITAKPE